MGFWTRMFSAVMCWFLTMITLLVTAAHYIPSLPALEGLGAKLAACLAVGAAAVIVLVGVLYFWLWLWTRAYWG